MQRMMQLTVARRRGPDHESAISHSFRGCFEFLCIRQQVRSANRGTRLAKRHIEGVHHAEITEAEVAHGPGRRANVERIARGDKNNSQPVEFNRVGQETNLSLIGGDGTASSRVRADAKLNMQNGYPSFMTIKGAVVSAIVVAGMAAVHCGLRAQNQQPPAAQPTRSVWDGIFSDGQAKRGAGVYVSECSSCHGKNLDGIDDAPSLVGKEFLDDWDGRTVGALFDKMRRTMPRDNAGRLSATEYSDVLAYLLSENKFPSGKTEMVSESAPLKQIRIQAVKPLKP